MKYRMLVNTDLKVSAVGFGPLAEGQVEGSVVTCPWHNSQFDLVNVRPLWGPARKAMSTYQVKVDDGGIFLAPSELTALGPAAGSETA